jgi:hypothetical protein
MARKSLSKKLRFEVFKRDSFTCQYCGSKAPDVILHVDHVHPVAEGGDDDILNLVTSCQPCNFGKGARVLSDDSVVEKRRRQLEELQARKEQIELMLEWHRGLTESKDMEFDAALAHVNELFDEHKKVLNEVGEKELRKIVRKFGLAEILTAATISFDHYADPNEAFHKIGGVAAVRKREREDPGYKDQAHLLAILRKAFGYNDGLSIGVIKDARAAGVSFPEMRAILQASYGWAAWRSAMIAATSGARHAKPETH